MADGPQPTTDQLPDLVSGAAHEKPLPVNPKLKEALSSVPGPYDLTKAFSHELSLASKSVHADEYLNLQQAVAPPMHVSTTFRYANDPDLLEPWGNTDPSNPYDSHIYSRASAPNTTRLEAILTSLLGAPSVTYSSGLSAFHAMLVLINPRKIAIGDGYHGCHGVIALMKKLTGLKQSELEDEATWGPDGIGKGDIIHVETPLNPTGEARDLEHYSRLAKERGAYLTVDATFAPPPLLEPLKWGADVIMHSGTKYIGGHSDLLCGVLTVNPAVDGGKGGEWIQKLWEERLVLGSVMGSLEGWLGVRSLRTLELRVKRQSESATKLVEWLDGEVRKGQGIVADIVKEVKHASLQKKDLETGWLKRQMPNGFGPVFALFLKDGNDAKRLPSKMKLFTHATSLGGVESLIEWRAMSDIKVDKRLLRISIGVEGWEDLKADLQQGFEELAAEKEKATATA